MHIEAKILPINNDFLLNYYKIPEPNTDTGIKIEKEYNSLSLSAYLFYDLTRFIILPIRKK